jgi:hypothetical protein
MSNDKHDKKEATIIINGTQLEVQKEEITFEELVVLAFPNPPTGENILFTIQYRRGHENKPDGTLKPGEDVKVKDGMIFDVTPTDRS